MQIVHVVRAAVLAAGVLAGPASAFAQAPDATAQQLREAIDQLRKEFDTRLSALEARLAAVEGRPAGVGAADARAPSVQTAQVPAGAQGAGGPTGALPVYGSAAMGSKIFNPDVAVIGNFLGASGQNDVNPSPPLEMHEAEATFQAIVDPYGRADFFVGFGPEGAELEEGFLTLTSLPAGLLTKVGRFRSAFGKVNGLHNHVLPWTDRPLVIENLAGGEEGIGDAGLSVAKLIPNPWIFLEATGQVFRGNVGEDFFAASNRTDLLYVGHLRGYHDLSESTNLDFGVSYAQGHNPSGVVDDVDAGRFTTTLVGVDATLRWRPLSRSIYRSFVGRSEAIWSRRDQFDGLQKADGYFVSGDYQFARRWFAGARVDRSKRAHDASLVDKGASALLTFWPSEFSQVRGQYRRIQYADGPASNEFLFQFQFSIGAHGAHAF
jgi:hypothetical protein